MFSEQDKSYRSQQSTILRFYTSIEPKKAFFNFYIVQSFETTKTERFGMQKW